MLYSCFLVVVVVVVIYLLVVPPTRVEYSRFIFLHNYMFIFLRDIIQLYNITISFYDYFILFVFLR